MQKVEGSNPFSRFFANALHVGGLASGGDPETESTIPAYRLHFGTSAQNGRMRGRDSG